MPFRSGISLGGAEKSTQFVMILIVVYLSKTRQQDFELPDREGDRAIDHYRTTPAHCKF
jgi:hypothetical protein